MENPNYQYLGQSCPKCQYGIQQKTQDNNKWWTKCSECETLLFCYQPMPHQQRFHADDHKFKMWAGGFGSAKTSTCGAEMVRLVLDTPNGTSLVGTQTYPQLKETAEAQMFEMLPAELISRHEKQNNNLILKNGHKILFRSFDDEKKIRSLNLCYFWIEEGSTVSFDIFSQLKSRLRNSATNHHKGLISTNPDINWIKTEFLLASEKIYGSTEHYSQTKDNILQQYSTHIAPTDLNEYLPPDFVETVSANKPEWWVRRYIDGSFSHAEGQVYPYFKKHVIPDFDIWEKIIKEGWIVYAGYDFGLRDPTIQLLVAVDQLEGKAYVFSEYFESELPVPEHAKEMKARLDRIPHGRLVKQVADPSGKKKSLTDNRSIFDHYAEYGLFFEAGDNRIDAGIHKVSAYLALNRLKIFESCEHTIREHENYRFKEPELDSEKNLDEKPIDKDNHTCDSLRYIVQALPDNPVDLVNPMAQPTIKGKDNHNQHLPYALQDDEQTIASGDVGSWASYY